MKNIILVFLLFFLVLYSNLTLGQNKYTPSYENEVLKYGVVLESATDSTKNLVLKISTKNTNKLRIITAYFMFENDINKVYSITWRIFQCNERDNYVMTIYGNLETNKYDVMYCPNFDVSNELTMKLSNIKAEKVSLVSVLLSDDKGRKNIKQEFNNFIIDFSNATEIRFSGIMVK